MSDERVTMGAGRAELPFQEFMIVERARGPIDGVELRGLERARPTGAVLAGDRRGGRDRDRPVQSGDLDRADPRAARDARGAPRRAGAGGGREPVRGGPRLKGPTERVLRARRHRASAAGIARAYAGVIDGIVADEPVGGRPELVTDTLMDTPGGPRPAGARGARLRRRRCAPRGRLATTARKAVKTLAILPVKSFDAAKQRLAESLGAAPARRLPRRCSPTCSARCGACPSSTRSSS